MLQKVSLCYANLIINCSVGLSLRSQIQKNKMGEEEHIIAALENEDETFRFLAQIVQRSLVDRCNLPKKGGENHGTCLQGQVLSVKRC